jgi:DNA repair protein RadC
VIKTNLKTKAMKTILNDSLAEITIGYSRKLKSSERIKITDSTDANNVLRNIFHSLEHVEYFYIICLDRANQVLGFHQVSKGGLSGTVTDVRVIFQVAIKSNSSGIILAHNHPSGNLQPSDADLKITEKIKKAGSLLDIKVLDHLILSEESYLSMADESLI